MQLEGKTALVTGGGRGIGKGIALAYAQEGADVAVAARTGSEVEQVAAEIRALGRKGLDLTGDLTVSQDAHRVVREAIQGLGKLDILVNNAGGYRLNLNSLGHRVPIAELTEEEWHRVIATNLTTVFLCCKAVIPHMMERRSGVIINMSSGAALKGNPGSAAYCAAKSAQDRLTEALSEELREYGIAVNSMDPGFVFTRPNDDYEAEVYKRMRMPEDTGPTAVFLALQTPETMTGQWISAPGYDEEHGLVRASAYERLNM